MSKGSRAAALKVCCDDLVQSSSPSALAHCHLCWCIRGKSCHGTNRPRFMPSTQACLSMYETHHRQAPLAMQDLVKLIQAQQGSTGIIYAHQRKTCDWLASKLGNAGVDAAAYHAGRDASERSRAQAQWMEGAFDCIVATVAFGMVRARDCPSSCTEPEGASTRPMIAHLPCLC